VSKEHQAVQMLVSSKHPNIFTTHSLYAHVFTDNCEVQLPSSIIVHNERITLSLENLIVLSLTSEPKNKFRLNAVLQHTHTYISCTNLLRDNSVRHTNSVYTEESHQFFHICNRSEYCSCLYRASTVSKHFLLFHNDPYNYKITGILKQLKFRRSLRHVSVHAGTIIRELFLCLAKTTVMVLYPRRL
jgi:hypothetical protein